MHRDRNFKLNVPLPLPVAVSLKGLRKPPAVPVKSFPSFRATGRLPTLLDTARVEPSSAHVSPDLLDECKRGSESA